MDKSKPKSKAATMGGSKSAASRKGKKASKSDKRLKAQSEIEQETEEEEKFFTDVEGVVTVALSPETQAMLRCVIGEQCSLEAPWIQVDKNDITEDIELKDTDSSFYEIRHELKALPTDKVFIGWNVMEEAEDQYFVCTTEAARAEVLEILEQRREALEKRLANSVYKRVGIWKSFGTERLLEEESLLETRNKLETIIMTNLPIEEPEQPIEFQNEGEKGEEDFSFRFLPNESLRGKFIDRRRYDNFCQARPEITSKETQTYVEIPTSSWFQYKYKVENQNESEDETVIKNLESYLRTNIEELESMLTYNGALDLHHDDYEKIVINPLDTKVKINVRFSEYESFIDVGHCRDSVITCAVWHPTLTGIVAVAYAENTRCCIAKTNLFEGGDTSNSDGTSNLDNENRVLIWSFTDKFKPKLVLESTHEVHSLAFCPMDGDILVGGLVNGQVLIWDLTDRLRRVEERDVLTSTQRAHRAAMMAHLEFMRPFKPASVVSPVAVSNAEFSQQDCVTAIRWICPRFQVSNRGRLSVLSDEDPPSLQFISISEDGTVALWDLQAKQSTAANAMFTLKARGPRPGKRRPPSLDAGVSPFRPLHRMIRPQFAIILESPEDSSVMPITCFDCDPPNVRYEFAEHVGGEIVGAPWAEVSRRSRYTATCQLPEGEEETEPRAELVAGNAAGEVARISWPGLETRTEQAVNSQAADRHWAGCVHDGPVAQVVRNPFCNELIASVGGYVWALWAEDEEAGWPVVWRRCSAPVCSCAWSAWRPSLFYVALADGTLQVWRFGYRSQSPSLSQNVSGRVITSIVPHPLLLPQVVIAIADFNGSLRLFFAPHSLTVGVLLEEEKVRLRALVERERRRRGEQSEWCDQWKERHAAALAEQEAALKAEEEERKRRELMEAQQQMNAPATVDRSRWLDMEYHRLLKAKRDADARPIRTELERQAVERWKDQEKRRMLAALMSGQRGDIAELQMPLQKLREHEKVKAERHRERMKARPRILADTYALLFPELESYDQLQKQPKPDSSKLEGRIDNVKQLFIEDYQDCEEDALNTIREHGFDYQLDWLQHMKDGLKCLRAWDKPAAVNRPPPSQEVSEVTIEKVSLNAESDEEFVDLVEEEEEEIKSEDLSSVASKDPEE